MSVVDFPGFVTDLKFHADEGGFHYHEDHHCIDITTGRQWWEIHLHPDYDCDGPLELHIVVDLDPRVQITFEDEVNKLPEDAEWPEEGFDLILRFHWRMPPLPNSPNLLELATELSAIGGTALPLHVWAADTIATVTDDVARSVHVESERAVPLAHLVGEHDFLDETFGLIGTVTRYLHDRAPAWLGE